MVNGISRAQQIPQVIEADRDAWLAGQLDEVEAHLLMEIRDLAKIGDARAMKAAKTQSYILTTSITILITLLTTTVTLILSGAVG